MIDLLIELSCRAILVHKRTYQSDPVEPRLLVLIRYMQLHDNRAGSTIIVAAKDSLDQWMALQKRVIGELHRRRFRALLAKQPGVAATRLMNGDGDAKFLQAKIATTVFFTEELLPEATALYAVRALTEDQFGNTRRRYQC